MFGLRDFFKRPGVVGLFIILETICFLMIIYGNDRQGSLFFGFTNSIWGGVQETSTSFSERLNYKQRYEDLLGKHQELLNLQSNALYDNRVQLDTLLADSTLQKRYLLRTARVIKNSISQKSNYLIINKGSNQGIKPHMGVINKDGIVGFVVKTTRNYARVISVLHNRIRVTAEIEGKDLEGSLVWDGESPQHMFLEGIPSHYDLEIEEQIVTGGSSSKFPPGILIGKIIEKSIPPGSSTYQIKIALSNDMRRVKDVFITEFLHQAEIEELEASEGNE